MKWFSISKNDILCVCDQTLFIFVCDYGRIALFR